MMNYYIWFKGALLVQSNQERIKSSLGIIFTILQSQHGIIDFVKLILEVKKEVETILSPIFRIFTTYKDYITMVLLQCYNH